MCPMIFAFLLIFIQKTDPCILQLWWLFPFIYLPIFLSDDTREQNGKMLPSVNSSNDSNNAAELVSINGSSSTSSSSNYYSVYGGAHLPSNNSNSSTVGMPPCYSSYPSNYSTQQLYPSQVRHGLLHTIQGVPV